MKETEQRKLTSKKLSFILSLTIILTILSFSFTQETPEPPKAEVFPENKTISDHQAEIEKKIEEKLNETLSTEKKEEEVDVLNKYKNFNLTEEVEKEYEKYQEDKDAEYFDNMDDLDKNDKYNKKQKKKNKQDLEEERYNKEWDEKVSKMHAHDLLTFRVNKKDFELFFEDIEQVPVVITCAFYLHEDNGKIDFEVFNNKRKTVFKLKSKNRGFYEFEVREPGRYEFLLSNERVSLFINKFNTFIIIQNNFLCFFIIKIILTLYFCIKF